MAHQPYHLTMIKSPLLFLILSCVLCKSSVAQSNDSLQYKFSSDIFNHIVKDSGYWLGGSTSSDLSFIGLYKEALIEWDKPRGYRQRISALDSLSFKKNYHSVDARKFILERAKENQIIIFNEAHYNSRNRVFVTSLLKDLRNIGYKYFAAEGFINDSNFLKKTHPTFKTGFYTMEPQFGNMVRDAIELNYSLYPYEDTTGANGGKREIGQVLNILSLLKKDPKAKIIIHCGFAHILEDSVLDWGKAMAGRLKEFTGIDPFTVDQLPLSERSKSNFDNPYYKLINSNIYTVLIDEKGKPFNNGRVDALLYSPPTKYIHNRPNWVFENNKNSYFLNEKNVKLSFPILVKVYLETDNLEESIPIDIIEIKKREDLSKTAIALFKKGRFIIKISNKVGGYQLVKVNVNRS